MNIYLIRFSTVDWDQYSGFVIQAKTSKEAIKLASVLTKRGQGWLENADWKNGYSIKNIGENNEKRTKVILSDYHAG